MAKIIIDKKKSNGANLGFEEKLWSAADKMRGHMDPGEYKHVVLGLIFLKYISDAFEELHAKLQGDKHAAPEDRDEYLAENVFWVPKKARWSNLQDNAKTPKIGQIIDEAMVVIEKENPSLKGVLPKDYGRPSLDKHRLGELIDLIGTIGLGDQENRSKDILGRVYEYFLSKFASQEGRKGGEFYTPRCVVKLLVEMIEPYRGRVYDPCCGSSGMFVQSEEFIKAHGGKKGDIAIYGQESNPTTWRLAKMNMAIRGIEVNLGPQNADTFHNDLHKDLKADFILANPPFNLKDWGGERSRDDVRWKYGTPPTGNANYAWIQHMIHHFSPKGTAGFVMANGSMSSNQSGEGEIRQRIIEADLVDCMIALPSQLFYGAMIPACLWFLTRHKKKNSFSAKGARLPDGQGPASGGRERESCVLFIDCRKMGVMADRTHRELTDEEISRIAQTYHAWRGEKGAGQACLPAGRYEDIPGFCKSATLEEVKSHGYVLTPGRYVGAEAVEDDGEPFEEKMKRFTDELSSQFKRSHEIEVEIKKNLKGLGWEL